MNALLLYRIGHWCYRRRIPLIPALAHQLIYLFYHAVIPMSAEIEEGVEFAHGGFGIVLHERCHIGRGVNIGRHVTISTRSGQTGVPVIAERAVISAGAKILGPVSIGADSVIAADAVVLDDVPAGTMVAGMPVGVVPNNIHNQNDRRRQSSESSNAFSFRTRDNVLVTVIDDPRHIPHLVDEWRELLRESAADSVFLTPEWLTAWWEQFGHRRALALVTLRRHQQLVGLAPFFAGSRRFGSLLPHRSIEFLGTGVVGSDYLDVLIRRGCEQEASRGFAEYLQRQGAVVTLSHLHEQRPTAEWLVTSLQEEGWTMARRVIETCPYITLAGHTWESYLSSLGSSHRYNFHRRLKNLHKAGTVVFEVVEKDDQRQEALQALLSLHNRRWDERGGSEAMQTSQELAFHEAFTRVALERGWLRLFVLRLDGKAVGAMYGLRYGRTFSFYQSGFDPAYRQQSVGLVTMGLAIQHAIAEGVEEYDFLHGTESYKFLWTSETRDLARIQLFPPSVGGALCRGALRGEAVAKRMAQRVLSPAMLQRVMAARRRVAA
jgi:serine acetyltransferase